MHHHDALGPVLRLDEMDTVEHGIAHLAMRMSHDDQVGLRRQQRQHGRRVLDTDAGGVVRRFAVHAAVNQHDLEI